MRLSVRHCIVSSHGIFGVRCTVYGTIRYGTVEYSTVLTLVVVGLNLFWSMPRCVVCGDVCVLSAKLKYVITSSWLVYRSV